MKTELPDPISEILQDTADEVRVRRLWRGIEQRQARRSRGPTILAAGVALAAAAALVWIAWPPASDPPGPIALRGGAPLASVEGPRELPLDDGSRIVLDEGARIEPLRNDASALSLLLARGRARFEVQPGGPRTWSVESGVATVEVVGTVFTVERGDGWARVEVERGVVMVRGERVPDRAARLTRGDAITIGEREARARVEPAPPAPALDVIPEPPPRPRVVRSAEPVEPVESVDALMARADEARRAGRNDEAVALLERAMAEDDPSAGVAAFTLGRLELDALDRPDRAVRAFSRALSLSLPPRLREDARARIVTAHQRAGDDAAARRAAEAYLAEHPSGRHAARVRALLATDD